MSRTEANDINSYESINRCDAARTLFIALYVYGVTSLVACGPIIRVHAGGQLHIRYFMETTVSKHQDLDSINDPNNSTSMMMLFAPPRYSAYSFQRTVGRQYSKSMLMYSAPVEPRTDHRLFHTDRPPRHCRRLSDFPSCCTSVSNWNEILAAASPPCRTLFPASLSRISVGRLRCPSRNFIHTCTRTHTSAAALGRRSVAASRLACRAVPASSLPHSAHHGD